MAEGQSRLAGNDGGTGLAGIGLLMQQDLDPENPDGASQSKVFIKSVVPGGACDRDGSIKVGDTVLSVNGENVVGLGVSEIRERIVGPVGSEVTVGLESGATGVAYERTLIRGNAQAPPADDLFAAPVQRLAVRAGPSDGTTATQSMSALSRSMDMRMLRSSISGRSMESLPAGALSNDMESQRLSRRIMELEAQLNMKDLELSRAKAMLESIAGSSEKTVKEVDVIQRKNSQQLMELQGMLNKSEQARRELEIQISNGTAREEEFHLAFSRAKEQTEAREHYFADLKLQLDELRNAYERDLAASNEEKNDYMRKLTKSEEEKEKIRLELKNMKTKETERREKELTVKEMLQDTEHKLIELKTLEEKVRGQSQALHLLFGQWHKDYFLNKSQEEAELENYFLA